MKIIGFMIILASVLAYSHWQVGIVSELVTDESLRCGPEDEQILKCLQSDEELLAPYVKLYQAKVSQDLSYLEGVEVKNAPSKLGEAVRRLRLSIVLKNSPKGSVAFRDLIDDIAVSDELELVRLIAENKEVETGIRSSLLQNWYDTSQLVEEKRKDPSEIARLLRDIDLWPSLQSGFSGSHLLLFKGMHAFFRNRHVDAEKLLAKFLLQEQDIRVQRSYVTVLKYLYRRDSHYRSALSDLIEATDDDNERSRLQLALAGEYWFVNRLDVAERLYQAVIEQAAGEREEVEALFAMARRIDFEREDFSRAIEKFRKIIALPQTTEEQMILAQHFVGFYLYLSGEIEQAITHLRENNTDELGSKYWLAVALNEIGDHEGSQELMSELATEFPMSYYGHLAYYRLEVKPDLKISPKKNSSVFRFPRPKSWPRFDKPVSFSRAEKLLELQLFELATMEIKEALKLFAAEKNERDYASYLIELSSRAQLHLPAILQFSKVYEASERTPTNPDIYAYFPKPYWHTFKESVENVSQADAEIMLAMARQESAFQASVVSSTFGYGLLQIQERTGYDIAKDLGLSLFYPEMLLDPRLNIRFSVHELRKMMSKVGSEFPFAVAAYNAGHTSVVQWKERRAYRDLEEFVENIPYFTTRDHVRNVLRNRANYYLLYQSKMPESLFGDSPPTVPK